MAAMYGSFGAGSSRFKSGGTQPSESGLKRKRGIFQKDLQHMMYGYGDDPNETQGFLRICRRLQMESTRLRRRLCPCLESTRRVSIPKRCPRYQEMRLPPLPESVALMEDIVIDYITDMVHKAQDAASKRGKLLTEDFLFLLRKDLPKLNRCTELLAMNEELKRARKAFEVDEEKLATED